MNRRQRRTLAYWVSVAAIVFIVVVGSIGGRHG